MFLSKKLAFPPLDKRHAWLRLAFALVLALDVHLLIIFLVPISQPARNRGQPLILQARILPPKKTSLSIPKPVLAKPIKSELEVAPKPASPTAKEAQRVEPESVPSTPAAIPPQSAAWLTSLDIPLISDPTYYPAGQLDVRPEALGEIKPVYPEAVENIAGEVILLLLIDETGAVKEVTVQEANPPGVFEESAINAFKNARFSPAFKNSEWVRSRVLIRVRYEPN